MRRRFGRGRGRAPGAGAGDARHESIDATAAMTRIAEAGLAGASALEPLELAGVPESVAALGAGQGESGEVLVGYSPHGGVEALLPLLALVASREGFAGTALAIAPEWSAAARRVLGLVRERSHPLRAIAAPQLEPGGGEIEIGPAPDPLPLAPLRVARGLERAADRELFRRALAGLEGLAAKHGGAVRGIEGRVDLLLLAQRVASLEARPAGVRLQMIAPDQGVLDLSTEGLATALDRLEGSLRKRLNDRRIRSSEEGLRTSLLPVLERAGEMRGARPWPLPLGEREALDLVGLGSDARLVAAAARMRLDLGALCGIVSLASDPRLRLPLLEASVDEPVSSAAPRLLLAAQEFEPATLAVLAGLAVTWEAFDIVSRGGEFALERRDSGQAPAVVPAATPARPRSARGPRPDEREPRGDERGPRSEERRPRGDERGPRGDERGPRSEERGPRGDERGRGRRDEGPRTAGEASPASPALPRSESPAAAPTARFEEVSLFDLEDEAPGDSGGERGARRRGRGRRRGRRGRGPSEGDDRARPAGITGERSAREPESRPEAASEAEENGLDDDETLPALADDVPEVETLELGYEDEETAEEGDDEQDRMREEREQRRRARLAKTTERVTEPPRPPRRRAAFVAHADRQSVLTAVLLARDVRLVEGFWVYPQEDLMTFFRGIATDLRDETPIFLVGFNASPPARDTLQAAALYRGRLDWYDHHDWPPEDLVALQQAIGEEAVHVDPGAGSSLAAVIAERTRRSRFSDKLAELATGRFSQHDYERWGRLWWHRLGEVAKRPGERRADIDALLAGRPSDLAKESARVPAPPPPPEVEYVASRDFRLVHFGGYVMVVLEVPGELDLHLAARIARERYDALLSLAYPEGGDLLVLGGDESRARRGLDLGSMADHLASKHEWIQALRDDDHVARIRVRHLPSHPDRLDEVIGEIAMGRSIVEG